MALMSLGLFTFRLQTAPLDEASRDSSYRHARSDPMLADPLYQFLGTGQDNIELKGVLYPQVTGGPINLMVLRSMAETGEAHLLMRGTGEVLGMWVITRVSETRTNMMQNGQAQRIDFSLSLERTKSSRQLLSSFGRVIRQLVDTVITGG